MGDGNLETVNQVLEFIRRRFPDDCNWVSGNCYYFAVILKARFSEAVVYYDVIYGHFVVKIKGAYYDHNGVVDLTDRYLVEWDKFDDYDARQKQVIIRDCIR